MSTQKLLSWDVRKMNEMMIEKKPLPSSSFYPSFGARRSFTARFCRAVMDFK